MTPNNNPLLIYVCAYHQEASAIIEHHKLKRDMSLTPFAYYSNDTVGLIETNFGKLNAASATAYIAGKFNLNRSAWLNIGIAGHRTLPLGEGVLCHKVSDRDTAINHYPDMRFMGSLTSHALVTVNTPEHDYPSDRIVDMEAAGFFLSACRFSTLEHIHSYKVISDNLLKPISTFDKNQTRELIENCLPDINALSSSLIEAITDYRTIYKTPKEYKHIIKNLHFTTTQQEQLKVLLRRWHALSSQSLFLSLTIDEQRNSKQLLKTLRLQIEAISAISGGEN